MKVLDLTHTIHEGMPVYPGTEPPVIKQALTIEEHNNREKLITMFSHTGTHMDAPAHMILDGESLDNLPVEHFIGLGVVIDCREIDNKIITVELLKTYENAIENASYVLFCNGWSSHWGTDAYFEDFPALSIEGAKWLTEKKLKGVGTDVISIDSISAEEFSIHKILLGANMVIVENLKGLERLINKKFTFICCPLKIEDGDGSPIRAIATIENE